MEIRLLTNIVQSMCMTPHFYDIMVGKSIYGTLFMFMIQSASSPLYINITPFLKMAAIFEGQWSENTMTAEFISDIILMIQDHFQCQKPNWKIKIAKK